MRNFTGLQECQYVLVWLLWLLRRLLLLIIGSNLYILLFHFSGLELFFSALLGFGSYLCLCFTSDFSCFLVLAENSYCTCRVIVIASTDYHSCILSHCCLGWVRPLFGRSPEGGTALAERSVGAIQYKRFNRRTWHGGYCMLRPCGTLCC